MEATASVKCPHCGADLQEKGVLEIKASIVDVDAEGRIAYEAKRTQLDEVEGYVCSVCNGQLDFEDDPVAEFTELRGVDDGEPFTEGDSLRNLLDDMRAYADGGVSCIEDDIYEFADRLEAELGRVAGEGCDVFVSDPKGARIRDFGAC